MRQIPGYCLFDVTAVDSPSSSIGQRLSSQYVALDEIPEVRARREVCACVPSRSARVWPPICAFGLFMVFTALQSGGWVQMIHEMPSKPVLFPSQEYINSLYLYLDSINLSCRTQSPAARNIALEVEFRDNDEVTERPLAVIAPRGGERELISSAVSTVTYKSKNPQFYDEIKVLLPAKLTDKHHFLIRIYNVAVVKAKSKTIQAPETYVGYTVLPVYQNQRCVRRV